jgi:hypothetical protein
VVVKASAAPTPQGHYLRLSSCTTYRLDPKPVLWGTITISNAMTSEGPTQLNTLWLQCGCITQWLEHQDTLVVVTLAVADLGRRA